MWWDVFNLHSVQIIPHHNSEQEGQHLLTGQRAPPISGGT